MESENDIQLETITARRMIVDIPYSPNYTCRDVINRFLTLVPRMDMSKFRSQTTEEGFSRVIDESGSSTGLVILEEKNFGVFISHFPPFNTRGGTDGRENGQICHKFVFGNPFWALRLMREDIETGLNIPMSCVFYEREDRSTRMVMMVPTDIFCGRESVRDNADLRATAEELDAKVLNMIKLLKAG